MRSERVIRQIPGYVVAAALLLTSCAPAVSPQEPTRTPATAPSPAAVSPEKTPAPTARVQPPANQARYGGVLTTVMSADVPSLDVQQETTVFTQGMVQCAYSNIVYYDPEDPEKIVGDLADRWEVSADGLKYTFFLRKGVKFHDGNPFSAEDAKFSLERLYNPPKGVLSPMKDTLRAIDSVDVVDRETIRVNLKFRHSAFLDAMACGQIVVYPKHVVEAKGHMKNTVLGTGPFQYKDYGPGVYFELVKNPQYFVPGRPYLDDIRFFIVRDDATRMATFRTGQVRFMGPLVTSAGIKASQARTIEKQMPEAKVYRFNALSGARLNMVTSKPPFNDPKLRQAVSLVHDRQLAIKVLLEGEGEIGSAFVPSQWAMVKEELARTPGYRQPKDEDIAQAKKLVAEAGYAGGLKIRILARANYTEDVAVFSKDQLAKIGIDAEVIVKESSVFLQLADQLAYETSVQPTGLRTSDPDYQARFYQSQGTLNWMGLTDKTVDDLFDKQGKAMDLAERKKLLRELEEKLLEIAPNVTFYWSYGFMAGWPEVKNFKPGLSVFHNNKYANVWLAK